MATGKPLIYTSLNIKDAGAATNITVELPDDENITVSNEVVEALVEGGETITQFFNEGIEAISYDLGIIDGTGANVAPFVQTNSTITDNKANITLIGDTGSVNIAITNVRVSAMRPFNDLSRDHVMIKATKSSTSGISVTAV